MGRKSKDRKEIERREAAMAGSNPLKSKLNRKTGHNWRESQRRFANRGQGRTAKENRERKRQRHHRSPGYYSERRDRDEEWAEKDHSRAEKKGWKRFDLLDRLFG